MAIYKALYISKNAGNAKFLNYTINFF